MIRHDVKLAATLGPKSRDNRSARILNRIANWRADDLECGADQRHGGHIARELGLCGVGPMSTPGTIDSQPDDDDEEEMEGKGATKH